MTGQMRKKKTSITACKINIVVMLELLAIFSFLPIHFSYAGYYTRGAIMIKPALIEDFNAYMGVAAHEYGHYIYGKNMNVTDLKAWVAAYNKCGAESDYAKTFRSKGLRMEEEFAENVRMIYQNGTDSVCWDKRRIINKYLK